MFGSWTGLVLNKRRPVAVKSTGLENLEDGRAELSWVNGQPQTRSLGNRKHPIFHAWSVLGVVVMVDVGLRTPDAGEPLWMHGGCELNTGCRDDISTPEIIACMRKISGFTYVPNCHHRLQPTQPSDL